MVIFLTFTMTIFGLLRRPVFENKMTILDVMVQDESAQAHIDQVIDVENRGAKIIHLHQMSQDIHPRIAPLVVLQRFYLDIEMIATSSGIDPDNPAGLKKVTQTL